MAGFFQQLQQNLPAIGAGAQTAGSIMSGPYRPLPQQPGTDFGMPTNTGVVPPSVAQGGVSQAPQGDPKQIAYDYAQSLGPPTDENIQKTADYMKSLGYDVRPNPGSDGFWLNGQGWDMVEGYKSGNPKWQQPLIDPPGGGGNGSIGGMSGASGQSPSDIIKGTPGFQFRFDEGLDALQRNAAAKGDLLTGGTLKDIVGYGQNFASNEFQNQWNRDMQLAGMGFNAGSDTGQFGSQYGNNVMSSIGAGANAAASGSNAQGNIWSNTAGQVATGIGDWWKKRQNKPPSPTAPGAPSPTDPGGGVPGVGSPD